MGKGSKKKPQKAAAGPKDRHKRYARLLQDPQAPLPANLVARPDVPKANSKHHSYFEFVENEDKKKKLEFQVTTKKTPPPGFEFVPLGHPALTNACKELSREKDAMIFIVSDAKETDPKNLSHHIYRTGHHVRQAIADEARTTLENYPAAFQAVDGPEPLPKTQDEYTAQVNSVMLDLFPRIPHTDRQAIIIHAFNLSALGQAQKPVGLVTDIPLSRRVQLAVLAHIRHNHTRYDKLLRETNWETARKVVESLCLDILVKWRGDEETGRDQLDEILREVVVISDSDSEESDDEDDGDTEDSSADDAKGKAAMAGPSQPGAEPRPPVQQQQQQQQAARPPARKQAQRGFKRYRAWEEAIERSRGDDDVLVPPPPPPPPREPSVGQPIASPGHTATHVAAGMVPQPNGFVSRPHPNHPPGHVVREQVRYHDPQRTTPGRSRHVTPVTDRLQDMLVRSIEPVSPNSVQPSFVRTVPPRRQPSPVGASMHHPIVISSPIQDGPASRPFYVERRVVTDRPPHEQAYAGEPFGLQPAPRLHPPVHQPLFPSRGYDVGAPPGAPQRVAVDTGRPGERSNPILMEDRGGFFERVREPAQAPDPLGPVHSGQNPWMTGHAPSRAPDRVVPWDEGSRMLHESRHDRNMEAFPAPGPQTLPPEARPHMAHYSQAGPRHPEPMFARVEHPAGQAHPG
ncbi:uncharacterized protein F5Z01DRAFT_649868 [Emericellopsis atlantica]|uniref:DUF2293 domain-containing protein n=1 Tax=Emericellopsis atlantica TaxID=2614577 RepID=A0A9P7ZQM1_9HYPO|nr:uncharacterized protein F5Z01DRAFT_649868 [Emericellopsis atlantica]KAG9256316.1 hypothetical protein F5Z01DRAFT_649868 [Emericellopsis atlantica]